MESGSEEGSGLRGLLPDGLKKAVLAGVGALFMSEEGVRSVLGDLKLPKEVAGFVMSQVAKTKEDLFHALATELREFLESTKLADELRQLLTTTSLQISTTVRFVPEDGKVTPRTKSRVKVLRTGRKHRRASPGTEPAPSR